MWKKGYRHGDISIYNFMNRKEAGRVIGVLNDWDLAFEKDDTGNAPRFTGTFPFAALDLIESKGLVPRRYRHDLQSFGWCLVYVCLDPSENKLLLRSWHDPTRTLAERKAFCTEMYKYTPRQGFEDLYQIATSILSWTMKNMAPNLEPQIELTIEGGVVPNALG